MKRIFISISALVFFAGCQQATSPNQLINAKASLPDSFKLSGLHQKVISTFINNKNHTTSLLYGNARAVVAASADRYTEIPGESFTLVTWKQQDDPHWFGARIPGDLISAETLNLAGTNGAIAYHYQKYSGKELIKLADTTGRPARIKFILSQKASIIP